LGRTPHAEILRVRLERAKSMLSHPNWTLDAIAARTGFRHGEYFSAVFKRGGPGTERDHRVPLQKQTKRIPRRARTARQESHRPLGYRFLRDLYGLCVQLPRDPPELKSRPG
jgi:transcriptional regulator GlxA family with amidase domain